MSELHIYVCENCALEVAAIVARLDSDDVIVKSYPCMCENRANRKTVRAMLEQSVAAHSDVAVLCGDYCEILSLLERDSFFRTITGVHCFHHLASPFLISYVLSKGGYIITSGWLPKWREHIDSMGFTAEGASAFFGQTSKELVYFDSGSDDKAEKRLEELSEYLGLPYILIPAETRTLEITLKGLVSEWRLFHTDERSRKTTAELQAQCAEYAAVLDILTQIAQCTDKRDIVEKVKTIFFQIMGATSFKFYDAQADYPDASEAVHRLIQAGEHGFEAGDDVLYLSVAHNSRFFGVFEAGSFLFPEYVNRYTYMADSISQICALAFMNIQRYEELVSYKEELEYKSSHDSLTGLFNRTHFDDYIRNTSRIHRPFTLFIFDLDGLKSVNDSYGHLEGDRLIIGAANVLKQCFRENDFLARIGGDEFTAIVENCDVAIAETLRKRIRAAIKEHNQKNEESHLRLSISVGYAVSGKHSRDMDDIRVRADMAMYEHKQSKRSGSIPNG